LVFVVLFRPIPESIRIFIQNTKTRKDTLISDTSILFPILMKLPNFLQSIKTQEIFEPEACDFLFLFNAFCTGQNIRVVAGRNLIVAIDSKRKYKYGQLNKKLMNYIIQRFYNAEKT